MHKQHEHHHAPSITVGLAFVLVLLLGGFVGFYIGQNFSLNTPPKPATTVGL